MYPFSFLHLNYSTIENCKNFIVCAVPDSNWNLSRDNR